MYIVELSINLWTGRRKMKPEELGLGKENTPPEVLASMGYKKIVDPAKLAGMLAIRMRAHRACIRVGTRFLTGYLIPSRELPSLGEELNHLMMEGYRLKKELIASINSAIAEWKGRFPEWERLIDGVVVDSRDLERTIQFKWFILKINPDDSEVVRSNFLEARNNLKYSVLKEIEIQADTIYQKSFSPSKKRATQKSIRAVKALVDKLEGLSFLDPVVYEPWVKKLRASLEALPHRGPIEGPNLDALLGVLDALRRAGELYTGEMPDMQPPPQALLDLEEWF